MFFLVIIILFTWPYRVAVFVLTIYASMADIVLMPIFFLVRRKSVPVRPEGVCFSPLFYSLFFCFSFFLGFSNVFPAFFEGSWVCGADVGAVLDFHVVSRTMCLLIGFFCMFAHSMFCFSLL